MCCLEVVQTIYINSPSDSISEGLIFQNFLGGMLPDPPRFVMLCIPDCVLCTQLPRLQ